ncbi:MAG: zf-HC2 domain-containing protein [Bryobacteraceae bacterium]
MDHSRIEEQNLIDRYVRGTLPAAERAEFEEHFVECAECQEQIQIAKSLRLAVRESVAEHPPQRERQWPGWRWMAIAACAALVIAVAAGSVFLAERDQVRTQLASARSGVENAPVVFGLSLSRDSAEPRDIVIPSQPRWIVFLAEIDTTRYARYRASVIGSQNEEIWKQDGIQPNSPDSISVAIPSSVLHPGAYTLLVSGAQPGGSLTPVARFPLRLAAGQ